MSANDTRKSILEELGMESDEAFLARLHEKRARRKEAAKPKVLVSLEPKMAEAIKANPDSLRVSARAPDQTVVVDRPRVYERVEVLEVCDGRPKRVRRTNSLTGEVTEEEWSSGYGAPRAHLSGPESHAQGIPFKWEGERGVGSQPNVTHAYDPFAALKGNEDE